MCNVSGRHWSELDEIVGRKSEWASSGFSLFNLLSLDLLGHQNQASYCKLFVAIYCSMLHLHAIHGFGNFTAPVQIEELSNSALKESVINAKLSDLEETWMSARLTFAPYKSRGNIVLKVWNCVTMRILWHFDLGVGTRLYPLSAICLQPSDTAELVERLEDSQLSLGSIASSRYSLPFRPRVALWTSRLAAIGEALYLWLSVQVPTSTILRNTTLIRNQNCQVSHNRSTHIFKRNTGYVDLHGSSF